MSFYGYVYRVTNLLNNKVYIGQKKGKFKRNYFGSGKHIKRSLNKYGRDNFRLGVIEYADCSDRLNELEKGYILKYKNDVGTDNVYNITDGGCGTCGSKWIYNDLSGEKKLIKVEEDVPVGWNLGCNRKGKNNPMFGKGYLVRGKNNSMFGRRGSDSPFFGKKASLEAKRKMSILATGKYSGANSHFWGRKLSDEEKLFIGNIGRELRWVYNKELNKCIRIKKCELSNYLDSGWINGRGIEFRKRCSELKIGERNPMFGKGYLRTGVRSWMTGRFGKLSPMFGKKHSDESKEKNRRAHLGKTAWNKGLTKETDGRVLRYSQTRLLRMVA